jgi:tetratricopeptide (TPR) repeat protein
LEIVDLSAQGAVQLCLNRDDDRRQAPPVPFKNPWEPSDGPDHGRELDWYLKDYLYEPLEEAKSRATEVESSLRNLGRLLYEVAFKGNDDAQGLFAAAEADGLADYQLVIVSADPRFLSLPWESLNGPDHGYLDSRLSGIVRRFPGGVGAEFSHSLPREQLNVLMVSPSPGVAAADSKPNGTSGSLAIETLRALDSLNVQVELDFLRPATVAALTERLAARPGHYHLVHLDGIVPAGPDSIALESDSGGDQRALVTQLGELLAGAGVPVALLNSGGSTSVNVQDCRIPSSLALAGVPLVTSVPFPLAGPAREIFLRSFYQALARGTDVAAGVAGARHALMEQPHRPTPLGNAVFWDWIGPKVFQSAAYSPVSIEVEQPPTPGQAIAEANPAQEDILSPLDQLPQSGENGLVGRRSELRQLERHLAEDKAVLLWGSTGVGKTELSLGLARWLLRTGARSGGVFYTSFEVGAGLERIVHEVGTSIAGLAFADLNAGQQRRWLLEYLRDHPSLLIWDALENAAGFPRPGAGLLDQAELAELNAFVSEVAESGKSWVLLVSRRRDEPWLTTDHTTFELGGLARRDAMELANQFVESAGVFEAAEGVSLELRLGNDYIALLDLVDGHPLALKVAAPLFKDMPASVVLKEIGSAMAALEAGDEEEGRPPYFTALVDYSFSRMSRRNRVHLPFLSLFQRRVMMDIMTHITQERVYKTVLGEELGWGACRTLLRSARSAGFLEPVNPSVFQINSSFPWVYGRRLHRQLPPTSIRLLEMEFVRVYADTADYFMETLYENQDSGVTAVLAEEGNLTQALGLALEAKQWDSAQLLVQPLAQVYRMQKRHPELRRLRRQLLESLTPENGGAAEAETGGAIELWLYLLGTEASEAGELGELAHAEDLNHQLLAYLTSLTDGDQDPRTAAVYHQLGEVAQQRWQLEAAEEYFLNSLKIIESGEDRDSVADDYYCLGQVRHHQKRYGEAKEWFSKALDIHQRSDNAEEMVKDYRALGLACQYRFEHDEAESWYQRAMAIVEENRDESTAILIYHELGTVCHARYQFDESENWYTQALTLSDRLGNEEQMAVEFHHLGLLAQTREVFFDDAENWYLLALEKYEALGDRRSAGDECRQLGVLFHHQEKWEEAEEWYHRAREIFHEIGDLPRTARTYGQLGMVAENRDDLTGALEWTAQTYRLAMDHNLPVLPRVQSHLARLRDKYGVGPFEEWWRGFMGSDPPDGLDAAGPELVQDGL